MPDDIGRRGQAMVAIGPYFTLSVVWGIADIVNGLTVFLSVIALVLLAPVVVRVTRDFLDRQEKG